jgi:hypothetical protein
MGADHRTTDFVAPPGGVMTDEVGAVTGDLTLRTEVDDAGTVTQRVQYKDADEWYSPTGITPTLDQGGIDAVHERTLAQLSKGSA